MTRFSQLGHNLSGEYAYPGRRKADYYATPEICLHALFQMWTPPPGTIWEPACGEGNLVKYLLHNNYPVFASDAFDYEGVDYEKKNFLHYDSPPPGVSCIITNPPYGSENTTNAESFITKAASLQLKAFALLLKANYWSAKTRIPLFLNNTPKHIFQLTWRPDFLQKDNPTMDVCWNVWESGFTGKTSFEVLPEPEYTVEMLLSKGK